MTLCEIRWWLKIKESQVVICFIRNTCTDPSREAMGPIGPIASKGRSA